ncbi:HupE/UreJ family protein [Roseomonas xinghualingensis]|uniref:HupE/UreJ family protein n=1 Tax=Roseomonas xinghualingensis TaxID=2986475 RepID=UPI0021F1CB02|nr:HupE/UreJ family protein [Roseomonas sp. SXEYE001]MCV4209845.1 HupE/UreJ family protein [Roseomonas sp. SXEYE001]
MAIHRSHAIRVACAGALVLASAFPALAHHPMGGQVPQTFGQGLLSGFGHPIIGVDHFAFVVALGITAALAGRLWGLTLSFVVGTVAGCLVHLAGVTLPVAELVIAATVLLLGAIIATNRELPTLMLSVLFAGAGLFHGWAYGESIFGAEQTSLIAYLAGFTLVQLVVAVLAGLVTRWVIASDAARRMKVRLAGAVVAGIGLALFVGHVEGMLFLGVK